MCLLFLKKQKRLFQSLSAFLFLFIISQNTIAQEEIQSIDTDLTTLSGQPLSLQQVALITLKNSPNILQGKLQVNLSLAAAQISTGVFDINTSVSTKVDKVKQLKLTKIKHDQDTQDLTLGVSKKFRTGIQASINAGITRLDNRNVPNLTENIGHLNVKVTIPLLKGQGSVSAGAKETAAKINAQAAEFGFYHNVSKLLLTSINAYWDYSAAIHNLKIQQEAEQRVKGWRDVAIKTIKSRNINMEKFLQTHQAEVSQTKAYLADKRQNTIAALDKVSSTKSALAISMGISYDQVDKIGIPAIKFEHDWKETLEQLNKNPMQKQWIANAMKNRLDIKQAEFKQNASAALLAQTKHDLLPRLNLILQSGHNAMEKGNGLDRYFDATSGDQRGSNSSAQLLFSYPLGNNIAKGQHDVNNAKYNISVIQTNNLKRIVQVSIGSDVKTLMRWMNESVETLNAIRLYKESLNKSYQRIEGRLLDDPNYFFKLTDIDEKLTDAQIKLTNDLLELAKSIAKLRFQTGTMFTQISDNLDTNALELADLSTLPMVSKE